MHYRNHRLGYPNRVRRTTVPIKSAFGGSYPPGYNARKNAVEVGQIANHIASIVTNKSNLPGWVEDYLAVARANLDQVHSYLAYEGSGQGVRFVSDDQAQFGGRGRPQAGAPCGRQTDCMMVWPVEIRRGCHPGRPTYGWGRPRSTMNRQKYYPPTY